MKKNDEVKMAEALVRNMTERAVLKAIEEELMYGGGVSYATITLADYPKKNRRTANDEVEDACFVEERPKGTVVHHKMKLFGDVYEFDICTHNPDITLTMLAQYAYTCTTWTGLPESLVATAEGVIEVNVGDIDDYLYESVEEVAAILGDGVHEPLTEHPDDPAWAEEAVGWFNSEMWNDYRKAAYCTDGLSESVKLVPEPYGKETVEALKKLRGITEKALEQGIIEQGQVRDFLLITAGLEDMVCDGGKEITANTAVRALIENNK